MNLAPILYGLQEIVRCIGGVSLAGIGAIVIGEAMLLVERAVKAAVSHAKRRT